jgi:hypothetical protein
MKTKLFSQIKLFVSYAVLAIGLLFMATPKAVAQPCDVPIYYYGDSIICPQQIVLTIYNYDYNPNHWYYLYRSYNGGAWEDMGPRVEGGLQNIYFFVGLPEVGTYNLMIIDSSCIPDPYILSQQFTITTELPTDYTVSLNPNLWPYYQYPSENCNYNPSNNFYQWDSDIGTEYSLADNYGIIETKQGTGYAMNFIYNSVVAGRQYSIIAHKLSTDCSIPMSCLDCVGRSNRKSENILDDNFSDLEINSNPNIAGESTSISYTVPEDGKIKIELFSMTGQRIQEILSEEIKKGSYSLDYNVSNLSQGVYILNIRTETQTAISKLVIIR